MGRETTPLFYMAKGTRQEKRERAMFTGLVDDVGLITAVADTAAGRELRISCRYPDLADGESIALNGVCLTVREHGREIGAAGGNIDGTTWFSVAAVVTTLGRTDIGSWVTGAKVNLERAMRLGDRLGGHLVLGHVDDLGTVTRIEERDDALLIDVALPPALQPLMAQHGSVTIDGVSLTVNDLLDNGVQLSIIEYTRRHTTLGTLVVGSRVHVEADVLAKHVARLAAPHLMLHMTPASAHGASPNSSRAAGTW
jgi:riboflavin synthase